MNIVKCELRFKLTFDNVHCTVTSLECSSMAFLMGRSLTPKFLWNLANQLLTLRRLPPICSDTFFIWSPDCFKTTTWAIISLLSSLFLPIINSVEASERVAVRKIRGADQIHREDIWHLYTPNDDSFVVCSFCPKLRPFTLASAEGPLIWPHLNPSYRSFYFSQMGRPGGAGRPTGASSTVGHVTLISKVMVR